MQQAQEYCFTPVNYMGGMATQPVEVSILNGREADFLDWRVNGFQLLQHVSAVENWRDDVQIQARHYPEIAQLAKSLSGCEHALVSSHISRNPDRAGVHEDYAPIQFVHSDFSNDYGKRIVDMYAKGTPDTAKALAAAGISADVVVRAKRILILQFWRNVGPSVMDLPLAFIDAQTVRQADMHPIHVPSYAGGDFAFDALGVTPPPSGAGHDWYVFPQMSSDEVVAFRTFDSEMAAKGEPYWTPHAAFVDPHAGADAPPRCSIELRATCLFS